MTDGLLSPINGLPVSKRWQADHANFFQKISSLNEGAEITVRTMYWVPVRPIENVGDPMRTRIENAFGKLVHNADVQRRKPTTGHEPSAEALHEFYEETTEEGRQGSLFPCS